MSPARFTAWAGRPWAGPPPRAVLVAAHPDDEVIGAGSLLPRFEELVLVHLSDGAPRDMRDARRAGFARREDYALARRRELDAALAIAGATNCRCITLGLADQEVAFGLERAAALLLRVLRDVRPDVVLTHPYEGGHPDHDAAALCCRLAVDGATDAAHNAPALVEFTSYHRGADGARAYGFITDGVPETHVALDDTSRLLKRRMLDCFVSQREVLAGFPDHREGFRPAPRYDWDAPPHPGPLWYEQFDWGLDGARWRELAAAARRSFGKGMRECA